MRTKVTRPLLLGLLVATSALTLSAQAPTSGGRADPISKSPYDVWTADQLVKPGNLANFGNYAVSVQRRAVGAAPEIHNDFSHIMMFTSGEGTFVTGGEIVTGPDGKKMIRGGDRHPIKLGEVHHVAINVPHLVVPNPGTTVTYFVANIFVEKKPSE
jgi:mannose-6-phosphate isomerase-like protein (cupin superfamily)